MPHNRTYGLTLGLLLGILAALMAAGGTRPMAAPQAIVGPAAPPATTIAAIASPAAQQVQATTATATPLPTAVATGTAPPSPSTAPSQAGATAAPSPAATAAAPPTADPTATAGSSRAATPVEQEIGTSVQGRPLTAYGLGGGPIKVVLVGDIHGGFEANTYELARQLLAYFEAHPEEVPPEVSLWIVPSLNPDGLETNHRWNANEVDLNRNADTSLDGCAGNDWSPDTVGSEGPHPGAGGPYPFSEPEAQAMRDLAADARIVVFYHSAYGGIFGGGCERHLPTIHLAEVLSEGTGYPIPEGGWTAYPVTGDFSDYLAGQGVAAVTLELTNHDDVEFERNLAGVQAILGAAEEIATAEAAAAGAGHTWLAPGPEGNTGAWHYPQGSFVHPIALEVIGQIGYLLDGGRVLALDLAEPAMPQAILAPGDYVEETRVLEPLDLAADGDSLLVLDRAGDVYRYEPAGGSAGGRVASTWSLERYDRPAGASYDHYFVALAAGGGAGYLLETTNEQVLRFAAGNKGAAWASLPQGRDVDLAAAGTGAYVLTRAMNSPTGSLLRYTPGGRDSAFAPDVELMHPRQVAGGEAAVYVLDRAGRRLLALDPLSGAVNEIYEFADRRAVSAVWTGPEGLILAGPDTVYFYDEPARQATVEGEAGTSSGVLAHDPARLEGLLGLHMPIEGAGLTSRDFQMPGAPRHYRLGVHEGMDFYGHTVGVTINRRTEVRAVADGVVIRALVDYQPLTAAQADAWQRQCLSLGYTPDEVLDGYRGRQVWIDHGDGLVSRYAHLSGIAPGIVEGAHVSQGQVIATVGNSGTPGSIGSRTYDVHLHLELWLGEHYVGQFLRPIEARELLGSVLW
jgi:murein DD-endopeptidase MepM/ murein hydrolase activator NlpD